MPIQYNHDHENEITLFGETNFRNERRRFGIKTDDRRRHMYVIGKTGMGKTTLLENLILQDVIAGHGCCYVDPHGDTAEGLLEFIPSERVNDVVYFNPADVDFPVGFNILETASEGEKPLIASGLMGVFKKIWPDVWSARMEYILMNCVLALLDYPGATLLGINRLLVDKEYRERVITKIRDPIVKTFWVAEFAGWSERYATEAIAPVQNKVGQFLSSSIIRNIVAQVKSTVNLRRIMDDGKILVVNLSKGRIGEDNMRLLGGMLITKMQLAAQERQSMPMEERRDFYLFVDEFQNFANESFASILSEARKFRLNLIVAHQYIEQLDEQVTAAIFGNVGTIIAMRVGAADAEVLEPEFTPRFLQEDLLNLAKYQMYLKLMVDGVATPPFSADSLPPISQKTGNLEKVIAVSRERYAEPRALIEEKVLRWSGMEAAPPIASKEVKGAAKEGWEVASEVVAEPEAVNLPKAVRPESSVDETAKALQSIMESDATDTKEEATEPAPKASVLAPEGASQGQEPVTLNEDRALLEDTEGEYLRIRPERLAAIQHSVKTKKSNKPKFVHTCSRCSKTWDLAIKLDPTRPMYCPECRPIVLEERKHKSKSIKKFKRTSPPPEGGGQDLEESSLASLDQVPSERHKQTHTPRVIGRDAFPPIRDLISDEEDEDDLLSSLLKKKKGPVELNKKTLEKRAVTESRDGDKASVETKQGAPKKKKRKRRRQKSTSDKKKQGTTQRTRRDEASVTQSGTAPTGNGHTAGGTKRVEPGERVQF